MKIKTLFSAAILHTAFLFPQETWVTPISGNWGTPANWTPPTVPNGVGVSASFTNPAIASNTSVSLDISPTVGTINFNSTIPINYQIGPSGPTFLTFSASSGSAAINIIIGNTGSHLISAPMTLTSNLVVAQASNVPFTLSGIMSGGGSFTANGTGTGPIILSGVNTYTGGTTVTAGTLQMGTMNAIPSSGTVTVTSPGTLSLMTFNQSIGPVAGSGTLNLGSAALTTTTSTSSTFSGPITGTGSLTLAGSGGTLILSNAGNSYTGGTTVSGSTLQLGVNNGIPSGTALTVNSPGIFNLSTFNQTVGVLAGNGSIIIGSGNLTTNTATNSTFSGSISGAGSLTQAGTSTLQLTGVSSYTGGTTVSAGTLQLGVNNALSAIGPMALTGGILDMSPTSQQSIGPLSGTSNITMGSAQLTINETSSTSYSGVMSGAGSLVMQGPATLTLGNTSSYTGGTTINGGILQLGINNALATTGSLTVNAPGTFNLATFNQTIGAFSGSGNVALGTGILTINSAATTTFSGPITGAGALVYQGPGMLTLTGTNTYSGGTTVTGGTLQGTTASLQGTIANSSNLIFNQTFPGIYAGTLTGTGSLFFNGSGAITLLGTQTQGNTTVNAGELIIGAGDLLTSPVTVAGGAVLSGSGTIAGAVTNNGTLQLGLNHLSIIGSYAAAANSTFNVDVTPTASGLLSVTGAVGITSPAMMVINIDKGIYAPSTLYTLVAAGAPVTGTFNAPEFANPFFTGSLIYNGIAPGSVQLQLQIAPFGNVIKGGNAGAIAECINLQAFPAESDLLPILQTLIFLPVEKVRDALEEMQPSQLKALAITEENNLVQVRTAISQRIEEMYKTPCNQHMSDTYNWNIWSNLSGDFLNIDSQRENAGFDAKTGTATAGIDTAIFKNVFLGAAGAYDYSRLNWEHGRGDATISSYYAGPYLSYFNRRTTLNASFVAAWNDYHVSRHIHFPTVDRHAKSDHRGFSMISHLDFGVMVYPAHGMMFSPVLGGDYIHLREKGFSEHDAGSLNLKIKSSHNTVLRSEAGLKIAKCAVFIHSKWTHDLKVSWIHQHLFKGRWIKAQFKEVDCIFTVRGLRPNEDYLDVATGLTGVFIKDKLSAGLRYEGKFGDGIRDNTAYLQLIYRF